MFEKFKFRKPESGDFEGKKKNSEEDRSAEEASSEKPHLYEEKFDKYEEDQIKKFVEKLFEK